MHRSVVAAYVWWCTCMYNATYYAHGSSAQWHHYICLQYCGYTQCTYCLYRHDRVNLAYFCGGITVLNEYVPNTKPPIAVSRFDFPSAESMACFALHKLISAGNCSSITSGASAPISYFLIVIYFAPKDTKRSRVHVQLRAISQYTIDNVGFNPRAHSCREGMMPRWCT